MSDDELRSVFREMLGAAADPHPFHLEVAAHLLAGRSVILKAPTGAGKTVAALLPYLTARSLGLPFEYQRDRADLQVGRKIYRKDIG